MTTPCSVRAMAAARENAHAKVEQEAALARHLARLVGRGLLDDAGGEAWLVPRGHATLDESAADFEVLAEIHAAAARVDVSPRATAAATAGTVVRRRATPPPRDDAAARAAAAAAGFGASAVMLPRLPVRPRYWDALSDPHFSPPAPPPHPAVADAARRAAAVGARAATYGGGVGIVGAALLALAGVHAVAGDGGVAARGVLDAVKAAATTAVAPVAAFARRQLAGVAAAPPSELATDLGRRLERSTRKGVGLQRRD